MINNLNKYNCPQYYNVHYDNLKQTYRLYSNLPYPYSYPYTSIAPNLVADNNSCDRNRFLCPLFYGPDYDPVNGQCHSPNHDQTTDLTYCNRDARCDKYDYLCYEQTPFQNPGYCNQFDFLMLVSNFIGLARNFDINLLDPWGIVIVNDIVWVANAGTGLITSYDLAGVPLFPSINVFGPGDNITSPTAIVSNINPTIFFVVNDSLSEPSTLLVATRDGTINGYNYDVDPINSFIVIDNSMNNSVYTGLALVNNILYAADFYNGKIDVFDSNYNPITTFSFIDEYSADPIPEDYAPFNIVNVIDLLYVVYAKQNPNDNQYELPGRGNGYISIFSLNGTFIRRFASRGLLNAPWGLVMAPSWFGFPSGSIMVANFGDGTVTVFDDNGKCIGNLKDANGNDICLDGIRALTFNPNYLKILYFTASADNLRTAFVGVITTKLI